jgi:hypothetical protein
MAKAVRRKEPHKRGMFGASLPLGKENFLILGIGLLCIIAGYAAMLEGSVEGLLPLVVAPILLVLGYCVIIPFGILYRRSSRLKGTRAPSEPSEEG